MKIFNKQQIYQADKFTIEKQQISSDELMERASLQLFEWIHETLQGAPVTVDIFCGIGNNGGDGLALARHLLEHGYNIKVFVVNYSEKRSKDFLVNLDRLKDKKVWPEFLDSNCNLPQIAANDIIVDAIFGIGLNRNPDDWVVDLIQSLNAAQAFVVSVDIPSGLFMEKAPEHPDAVIQADLTLSFQAPKLVFFLPQTGIYTEYWEVLDIGLDSEYLSQTTTSYSFTSKTTMASLYRPRQKFSHKGTYGHAMIVGGSYGKIGAVHLSAKACLQTGAGLVTAFVPQCAYGPLQSSLPEAMVLTDIEEREISAIDFSIVPSVVGIGMGMGTSEKAVSAFSSFLEQTNFPLVVDADALNILARNTRLLKKLSPKTVLTPHPKELERLIGPWQNDFEKLAKVKAFSKKYDCIIIVKGAHTITVYEDHGYVNATGNPGMATAGSGDVLTGMVTALISQGYEPLNAAVFGVYLHGLAGDLATTGNSLESLTATRIIDFIGKAFVELFRKTKSEQEKT